MGQSLSDESGLEMAEARVSTEKGARRVVWHGISHFFASRAPLSATKIGRCAAETPWRTIHFPMRVKTFLFVALLSMGGLALGQDYPKADISNGVIRAELMLPDPQHGSYQGTRFDWSGIISSLQYQGHEYFGKWYEKHDPKIHDAITGPVEEFRSNDSGLGYEEAKAGGTFVRIGVGTVRKPEEKAYRPYDTYEIVDPGKWTVKRHKDSIEFTHRLRGDNGYAYVYRKTVRLVKGKPELVLEHWLKNTGQKAIDTTQYNHNFFVIDHEAVGPDVVVKFPFTPVATRGFKDRAEIAGNEIQFPRAIEGKNGVFSELTGSKVDVADYDFHVENVKSGAGVHITSDQPLDKVNFWAINTVASVEPYIHLNIQPEKEARWTVRYQFYTFNGRARQ